MKVSFTIQEANGSASIELDVISVKMAIEEKLRRYHEEEPFFNLKEANPDSHIGNLLRTWQHLENISLGCHVNYPRFPAWHSK